MPLVPLSPSGARTGSHCDLIWSRSGTVLGQYRTAQTARGRAADLRVILAAIDAGDLQSTDTIYVHGDADFGDDNGIYGGLYPLTIPAANYVGVNAQWRHNIQIDAIDNVGAGLPNVKPSGTTGFILSAGNTTFTNFTLKQDNLTAGGGTEDGGIICWNEAGITASVTFTNCILDGSAVNCDWLFYNWTSGTKTVTLQGCTVYFSRFGIAMVDASGSATQTVDIDDCTFVGNAQWSASTGESSGMDTANGAALTAVLNRSGVTTIDDSTFTASGRTTTYDSNNHGCPRIATIYTDSYYSASQANTVTVTNCAASYTAGNASVTNDIDVRFGTFNDGGGNTGMGGGGGLKVYS